MSFSPASLRLLRRQLRSFEISFHRQSSSNVHAKVLPRCPAYNTTPLKTFINAKRPFTTYSSPTEKLRTAIIRARLQYPVLLPFLFLTSVGSVSFLALLLYDQYTRVDTLSEWPAPVEEQLRMALHWTHVRPDPRRAAEHFGAALEVAETCGLDPFSKEVMGVRIRLAEMLEQFGRVKSAIQVLDGIVKDCEERLSELSRSTVQKELKNEKSTSQDQITAMVRGIIQAKVKIAELYESEYIQDPQTAKKTLSDAVDLLVRNAQDPKTKFFAKDNAAGLTLDEIAAMLDQMAHLYNDTGEEANAIQVYFLTLNALLQASNGQASCREVEVMGNIGAVMGNAIKKPNAVINGKPATPESTTVARKAAINWCDRAQDRCSQVPNGELDAVCAHAVLAAAMVKAALLEEDGQYEESKMYWTGLLENARHKMNPDLIVKCEVGLEAAEQSIKAKGRGKPQ